MLEQETCFCNSIRQPYCRTTNNLIILCKSAALQLPSIPPIKTRSPIKTAYPILSLDIISQTLFSVSTTKTAPITQSHHQSHHHFSLRSLHECMQPELQPRGRRTPHAYSAIHTTYFPTRSRSVIHGLGRGTCARHGFLPNAS